MSMDLEIEEPEMGIVEPAVGQTVVPPLPRLGKLAYHGLLSMADQMVVSGTRFLTSVIVGRACGPEELGDYTLGFTIYCVFVCIEGSLISVPFTMYRHRFADDEQRAYAGSTLVHYGVLGLLVLAILAAASGAMALGYGGSSNLALLVAILGITFPLALLVEFARRFAFARFDTVTVLVLDLAMSAIQVAGLLWLAARGTLTAESAYLAMGIGAALAGLTWLATSRKLFLVRRARLVADALRNVRCGHWFLWNQLTLAARPAAILWLVAFEMDATWTGIFAACDILTRMTNPLLYSVANVLLPNAARASATGDTAQVRQLVFHAALVLFMSTVPLFLLFLLCGDPMLAKLYGDAYSGQGIVVAILALAGIADALDTAATNGLLAIDRPNASFVASLIGTIIMLAIAALLVPAWGIVGAAVGSLVGRSITPALQWLAFLRQTNRPVLRAHS